MKRGALNRSSSDLHRHANLLLILMPGFTTLTYQKCRISTKLFSCLMQQEQESFEVKLVADTNSRKMYPPAKLAPVFSRRVISCCAYLTSDTVLIAILVCWYFIMVNFVIWFHWIESLISFRLIYAARDVMSHNWPERYRVENCLIWWWIHWMINGLLRFDITYFEKWFCVQALIFPFATLMLPHSTLKYCR